MEFIRPFITLPSAYACLHGRTQFKCAVFSPYQPTTFSYQTWDGCIKKLAMPNNLKLSNLKQNIKDKKVIGKETDTSNALLVVTKLMQQKLNKTSKNLSNTNYVSIPRIFLLETCCLFIFYILSRTKSLCSSDFCCVWHLSNPKVNRPKSSLS